MKPETASSAYTFFKNLIGWIPSYYSLEKMIDHYRQRIASWLFKKIDKNLASALTISAALVVLFVMFVVDRKKYATIKDILNVKPDPKKPTPGSDAANREELTLLLKESEEKFNLEADFTEETKNKGGIHFEFNCTNHQHTENGKTVLDDLALYDVTDLETLKTIFQKIKGARARSPNDYMGLFEDTIWGQIFYRSVMLNKIHQFLYHVAPPKNCNKDLLALRKEFLEDMSACQKISLMFLYRIIKDFELLKNESEKEVTFMEDDPEGGGGIRNQTSTLDFLHSTGITETEAYAYMNQKLPIPILSAQSQPLPDKENGIEGLLDKINQIDVLTAEQVFVLKRGPQHKDLISDCRRYFIEYTIKIANYFGCADIRLFNINTFGTNPLTGAFALDPKNEDGPSILEGHNRTIIINLIRQKFIDMRIQQGFVSKTASCKV